jgi:malonyl-CoA O-methyltransferase
MSSDRNDVIRAFDAAAATYDSASPVQREIARELVSRASRVIAMAPRKILDLGCGAGHVTEAALERWPDADFCALDAAPAMLEILRAKFPKAQTLVRDALQLEGIAPQDLILSSMMLHWLPNPRAALVEWRKRLAPKGRLHVAVPVEGSLAEWSDLFRSARIKDGLWIFPEAGFANDLCETVELADFGSRHASAKAFLQSLKATGANRSPVGHQVASPAVLRRLLSENDGPFSATFRIAFLTLAGNP